MKFKSVLFLFLASIILFGFSQQTNAESQESNVTPSQESYAPDVLNEQLSSSLSTTDAIQQSAAYAPSTWYYTTYRSYVGYPPATIYVSVENTAVKRRYHGYLTLISTGYAPGNWRTYAGTLYLQGGPYPIPSSLKATDLLVKQEN
ncbi:hypothetical protein ACOMOD_002451 [Enterococcus faecalis]|jgi:hypothetical protein|uniref:hypothetical protein n=1 Tax=Enterococcus TaxID=1350 RepID=UPI0019DDEB07|nr:MULTISPECIES: hypothetical protein [Enterococcus]EGO8848225.1 hypothetical protein [Enterococcus faecalis]EIQ7097437.1 hypothetical protein [Enterococcus faecalis]MBO6438102.1 hypothetical protein [Enterococcus faecalis]MBO6455431.1 hypothetical protein [Enterococcus faecalis]